MRMFMPSKKMFGLKSIEQVADTAAAFGANPVRDWFWQMSYDPLVGTPVGTFAVKVEITYYCKFFDRKAYLA